MKKILSILLIVSLLFITGCDTNGQSNESSSDTKQQPQEPEVIDVFSMFEPYEVEPIKLGDDGKYKAEDYRKQIINEYKIDNIVHNLKIGNRIFEDMRLWRKTVSAGGDITYYYDAINGKEDVFVDNAGGVCISTSDSLKPLYSIDPSFQFTEESLVDFAKEAVNFYFGEVNFDNYYYTLEMWSNSENIYSIDFFPNIIEGVRIDGSVSIDVDITTGVEKITYTPTLTNLSDHEIDKAKIMHTLEKVMKETGCYAIFKNPENILKVRVIDHKAYIYFVIQDKEDFFHAEYVIIS